MFALCWVPNKSVFFTSFKIVFRYRNLKRHYLPFCFNFMKKKNGRWFASLAHSIKLYFMWKKREFMSGQCKLIFFCFYLCVVCLVSVHSQMWYVGGANSGADAGARSQHTARLGIDVNSRLHQCYISTNVFIELYKCGIQIDKITIFYCLHLSVLPMNR